MDVPIIATAANPTRSEAPEDLPTWIRSQQARLWRYLRLLGAPAEEAEDVLQETFVRVLERRPEEHLQATEPMLRSVARNLLIDRRRSEARRQLVDWSRSVDEFLAEQPASLEDARITALKRCLERLTPRARTALLARHVDERSVDDVARLTGTQREGARALLRRSRDQLRECTHQSEEYFA